MRKKILKKLNTKILARNIIYYETIDSTQKEIWRRIENDQIENGTLIIADIQTDGIGTHGRKWYTSQKENIAFSFVLYPNIPVSKLENISVEIAQIIVEVFKKMYQIELEVKVPNDIVKGTRKIGGVLTETKLNGEIVKYLVVGIGMESKTKNVELMKLR